MDPLKKTVVEVVKRQIRWLAQDERTQNYIMNAVEADEAFTFEFQDGGNLDCLVRINQGPYKGPRYFEVILKERY